MTENNKKTCKYESEYVMFKCDKPLFDEDFCIFHSKDIEGKKDKFNNAFEEEFERQKEEEKFYNFIGFVFPKNISFGEEIFEKDVYFTHAQFSEEANFAKVQFSGMANFWGAKFSEEAEFRGAKFSGETHFWKAQFSGKTHFWKAQFSEEAIFENAQFSKKAFFVKAQFSEEANFSEVQFSGTAYFWNAQFSGNTHFWNAQFSEKAFFVKAQFSEEADFWKAQFSGDINFRGAKFYGGKLTGLFEALRNRGIKRVFKGVYKIEDFRFHLSEKIAKEYPVIDRMAKDAWYLDDFKNNHPFIYSIWNISAKCGHSILRWVLWSLFFAVYFGINYYCISLVYPTAFHFNDAIQHPTIWSYIYYSVVTFTTLGFGDIIPTLEWVQRWVMAEVVMGYVMLGGLISILANKLARRS